MKEYITHESGSGDAWICVCGNTPSDAGFYPIDSGVSEVEATLADWTTNEYFCNNCGRVIDQDSLEVTRRVNLGEIVHLY